MGLKSKQRLKDARKQELPLYTRKKVEHIPQDKIQTENIPNSKLVFV